MNKSTELRLLVVADVHYDRSRSDHSPPVDHPCGCALLRWAIDDAASAGGFDALALMGDLLEDGQAQYAEGALAELRQEVANAAPKVPLFVVPGNHDGDPERLLRAFEAGTGLRELGGYRFVVFADPYPDRIEATRTERDQAFLRALGRIDGRPIVALQHSPIWPEIIADYPYMLTNFRQIAVDYAEAGVCLSISGHYHPGQPLSDHRGVKFLTAPALCKWPFPYLLVRLAGREATAERRALTQPDQPKR